MDDLHLQQLFREVKIQTFLAHPHIVKLYNFFVDEDSAYLVLEPCLGRNLYENLMDLGTIP
jgi:calcium-dependent protein kinase